MDHVSSLRPDFELIFAAAPESLLQLNAAEPFYGVISHSYFMKSAYELILANFPKVLHVSELSASLGIHRRSFEKVLHKTFGLSYVHFVRVLRVYESWHLMQYTKLDNSTEEKT